MIAIINTGEFDEDGRSRYRVQINDKLITEYYHWRIDGLAACLALAAHAVDRADFEKIDRLCKLVESKTNDGA